MDYKIAIVHDDLIQYGGAERVVEVFHEIWPSAPIYTSFYDRESMEKKGWSGKNMDIRTSYFQNLPKKSEWANKFYLPIFPLAMESFDFSEYDVVLSSSTRFAHGIITKPETLHVCYCNSPARFLWMFNDYEREHGRIKAWQKPFLLPIIHWQRMWDLTASKRPDFYLANSSIAQKRIKKYYHRDSEIIFPPVDVEKFIPQEEPEKGDYFIIVSRLAGHKRFDIAVSAFNKLGGKYKLKIIGSGDKKEELQKLAKNNIEFLGFVSDEEKIKLLQSAKAFLYPQIEDFGITAVEAQAAGIPVIGFGQGGLLDTVIPGKTGVFFEKQDPNSLIEAVTQFEKMSFKKNDCIENAKRFGKERFKKRLKDFVEERFTKHRNY